MQKIIVDTDPGIDDVLALLFALHCPTVEVLAINLVAGNVSLDDVYNNLLMLFDVIKAQQELCEKKEVVSELKNIPYKIYSRPFVAKGAAGPMAGEVVHAGHIHGTQGLGGVTREKLHEIISKFKNLFSHGTPSSSGPSSPTQTRKDNSLYQVSPRDDAVSEMLFQLENHEPGTIDLVMLGPLTNLAMAIKAEPELRILSRVRRIFVMGGAIHQPTPGGNITPNAEFNFYFDPIAASIVMGSGLPITLVPLDVTETCRFRYGVYEETVVPLAQKSPLPSFVSTFLEYIFNVSRNYENGVETTFWSALNQNDADYDHTKLLDLTINEIRAPEEKGRLEENRSPSRMLSTMIESDNKSKSKFIQSASLAMHDPLCMAVCLFPELVTKSLELNVKVETAENSLTKGMTIVDGRRWKVKQPLKEEIEEFKTKIAEESPAVVTVVFQADTNLFFKKFLGTVFGLEWNEATKQWISQ